MTRPDAAGKLRGAVTFGTDLERPGMLWGALVPSPAAAGRLRAVDLGPARRTPGVVAAIGAEELRQLLPSALGRERPLFPVEEVAYRGQPVAAVAASTRAAARAAARAARVTIEERRPVADVEDRYPEWPGPGAASDPGVIAHVRAGHGNVASAFARATLVHSETYRTSGVCQVALEPHACVAEVSDGVWRVTSSTQTPFGVRDDTAEILGLPAETIVVDGTWVGGGFGGKGAAFLEPYALALARASGRPVELALSYREEFRLGRSTLAAVIRLDTAVIDRTIVGRRVRLLLDTGSSLPGRDFATGYSIGFLVGPYRCGAVEVEGFGVRTNKPPFGPHRAPFAPQCVFALESHLDGLARRLGVDPLEFRLAHVWREGDETFLGQKVGPFGGERALRAAAERARAWRPSVAEGHGLGAALGFWSTGTGAGGEVRLRLDGRALRLEQVEREIGSGSVIAGLTAVAARATGLPARLVRLVASDTATAPVDSGVFGSRTVAALGRAIVQANEKLLATLARRAGGGPVRLEEGADGIDVVGPAGRRPVAELLTPEERDGGGLVAEGRHYGNAPPIDPSRVEDGTFYPYTDFTASVDLAEVEVDPETGSVRVVRAAAFQDVGAVISEPLVRAQVEGGFVMGLGEALTEETLWSPDATLLNPSLLDYRIPTLLDVPPLEITLLEGAPGAGPFGAKGVGEPPILAVPAAVANAVADATGRRVRDLPLTPERVSRALIRP